MFKIRYALESDKEFWFTLDEELSENEFILKAQYKRGYLIYDDDIPIGIMRYNFMWDIHPFLTLIILEDRYQNMGIGKKAMTHWENEMRELGYKMVMTSTQVNESAQHFYRKLGYIDKGSLFLDNTPFEQPQELILLKIF